ncbi:hypothetical protein Ancab_032596 [Ancistrocladus abbreviatus]
MARANQGAIDTFISITGSTEAIAIQRLEEYGGDLNAAINAHFSEGDRNVVPDALGAAPQNDFMDIDDPLETEPHGPPPLLSAATRGLNPFSLLDPNFTRRILDRSRFLDRSSDIFDRAPHVTHPREVRQIPIEVKDENTSSGPSGRGPLIEDVTGTEHGQGPEIHGTVVIDNEDENNITTNPAHDVGWNEQRDQASNRHPRPSAPNYDVISDYGNDVEEEMIRAAIEASKKDAELQNPQVGVHNGLNYGGPRQGGSNLEDPELAHAVSLSLKTAELERKLHEQVGNIGAPGPGDKKPVDVEELGKKKESNEGLGLSSLNEFTATQTKKEAGSSSIPEEVEELEEQPLVRHRSRRMSPGSVEAHREVEETEVSPELTPQYHAIASHSQHNGNTFPSDEWGGISSEEHDEAVMLEAAMFGGIPEESRHRFPYAPHQFMQSGFDRAGQAPRPPSPGLAAHRLIREQQDDEYLASLQADREKELKAMEEENAARQAALEEQKQKEEESRRKLAEEQEIERLLAAKEASLPEEPAPNDENAVTLLVRMPDGTRSGRRFLKTHRLQSLFDFIDIGRRVKPGSYRLVRPYPLRAFSDGDSNLTLNELGLTSKQEALFLELI